MKIWFNAGEHSGDMQAATLLRALQNISPDIEALGMGGINLDKAGMRCLLRVESLSVMGVVEVIGHLPKIVGMLREIWQALKQEKPDAVILIDAPDFNFFVARMAKKLDIPVYYFIPPKIWAWRSGRAKFLKKYCRRVYAILPFELEFYKKYDVPVEYVGNPLVNLVNYPAISTIVPIVGRIGLMPGSRKKEVESLLPEYAKLATIMAENFPDITWHVLRSPNLTEEYIRSFWSSTQELYVESPENPYMFMRSCQCIVAASGTATLETGLAGVPTLVTYMINPVSYAIARCVVNVRMISLANLIMGRFIFPELLQKDARGENIAKYLTTWLSEPHLLEEVRKNCDILRILCGEGDSAHKVSISLLKDLG